MFDGCLQRVAHRGGLAHVAVEVKRLTAGIDDFSAHRLARFALNIGDDNAGAFPGETPRHRASKTTRGTGDESDFCC